MSHVTQKSTQKHLRIPPLVFEVGGRRQEEDIGLRLL
jgi:hypothetical protein